VHRDIKPENILVKTDDEGNPVLKICDFGLSRPVSAAETSLTVCGTPYYMAPELCKAFSSFTSRTVYDSSVDIYAVGILMWAIIEQQHGQELQPLTGEGNLSITSPE
jgi:serine/threonine protein kinase